MIPGWPKEIILSTGCLGGVGDHSLYTTLPERFSAEGHDVFLSDEMIARNDETIQLFWGLNPFVKGVNSRLRPNAGYPLQGKFYDELNRLPLGCNIEAMERVHGLPPPYSKAPKIYYAPKPYLHDLSKATVLDMHSLSSSIMDIGWAKFHQKMTDRFGPISLLTFPEAVVRNPLEKPEGVPSYHVDSIYTYCDILAACRAWIGSEAGGQALAAAVRGERDVFDLEANPQIVSLMAPNTFNSRAFCFRGVDYRTSKFAAGDDYLEPVEVPFYRYHEICKMNIIGMRERWRAQR